MTGPSARWQHAAVESVKGAGPRGGATEREEEERTERRRYHA